jgi:hypothetical protein
MTDDERKKLRDLAEAATPGPWHSRHGITTADVWPDDPTKHPGICNANNHPDDDTTDQEHANAAFIAAANPQAVVALLDLVDKQALHITHLVMQLRGKDWHAEVVETRAQLAAANAEIERLRATKNKQHEHERACLERQLAAMTAARNEACDIVDRITPSGELLGVLARIAELRKVGTP